MKNQNSNNRITIILLLISALYCACSDVLLEDLSTEKITLLAPANNIVTPSRSHIFWWEALDDVDSYTLQIVTPSFDSIAQLIATVDITEGLTHEMVLNDGEYQWTVIGSNSVSETAPTIYNLTIISDSTGDLSQQTIFLESPEDALETNETDIDFLWQSLGNVNNYHFQLASPDFSSNSFILEDEQMSDNFFLATLSEGTYQWRVRGENDLSVTLYTQRSLTIDLTVPDSPILSSPTNADSLNLPILLSWNSDATADIDSLFVYPDSLVSTPIVQLPISTNTSYTFNNQATNQFYFWRVKSTDKAGNSSSFSSVRKFFVNN